MRYNGRPAAVEQRGGKLDRNGARGRGDQEENKAGTNRSLARRTPNRKKGESILCRRRRDAVGAGERRYADFAFQRLPEGPARGAVDRGGHGLVRLRMSQNFMLDGARRFEEPT